MPVTKPDAAVAMTEVGEVRRPEPEALRRLAVAVPPDPFSQGEQVVRLDPHPTGDPAAKVVQEHGTVDVPLDCGPLSSPVLAVAVEILRTPDLDRVAHKLSERVLPRHLEGRGPVESHRGHKVEHGRAGQGGAKICCEHSDSTA